MSLDVTIWSAKSTSVPGKVHCLKSSMPVLAWLHFITRRYPSFPPD